MTKRHFERLAAALAAARKDCTLSECPITDASFEIIADQIALACNAGNPRFDYDRFIAACKKG